MDDKKPHADPEEVDLSAADTTSDVRSVLVEEDPDPASDTTVVPALAGAIPTQDTNDKKGKETPVRIGFFQRITIHLLLMITLSGAIALAFAYSQIKKQLLESEITTANTMFESVRGLLVVHFLDQDRTFSSALLSNQLATAGFLKEQTQGNHQKTVSIRITDIGGQPVVSFRDSNMDNRTQGITKSRYGRGFTFDEHRQALRVGGQVYVEGVRIAALDITMPTEVDHRLFRMGLKLTIGLILGLSFAIISSFLFARLELAPIKALTRSAHQIRLGKSAATMPISRMDEIGELTATFNGMVSSLGRRIEHLQQMQDAVVKVGRELDPARLHATLVLLAHDLSGSNSCRLYLFHAQRKRLEEAYDTGGMDLPSPDDDLISHLAFSDRWAQFVQADGHPTNDPALAMEMAIPLLSGKDRIGVLRIGHRTDGKIYDAEVLAILHTYSQFVSVTIENARLYNEIAAAQRLEQEMQVARNIQESMHPSSIPNVQGFDIAGRSLAALEVGGDYFDIVRGHDGTLHIFIADVSGKGVPAALIMSNLRSQLHTLLNYESLPERFLTLVNRSLSKDLDQDMFVTLSAISINEQKGTVHFARAGHEPLMIRRADGTCEIISSKGAALGLLDPARFEKLLETKKVEVRPGDTILLYTDGITEARNLQGEEFGHTRLEHLLLHCDNFTAAQFIEKLLHSVESFAGKATQQDDLTAVVIRRI